MYQLECEWNNSRTEVNALLPNIEIKAYILRHAFSTCIYYTHSKKLLLFSLAQTNVITLKTQMHALNARSKRVSQLSFRLTRQVVAVTVPASPSAMVSDAALTSRPVSKYTVSEKKHLNKIKGTFKSKRSDLNMLKKLFTFG